MIYMANMTSSLSPDVIRTASPNRTTRRQLAGLNELKDDLKTLQRGFVSIDQSRIVRRVAHEPRQNNWEHTVRTEIARGVTKQLTTRSKGSSKIAQDPVEKTTTVPDGPLTPQLTRSLSRAEKRRSRVDRVKSKERFHCTSPGRRRLSPLQYCDTSREREEMSARWISEGDTKRIRDVVVVPGDTQSRSVSARHALGEPSTPMRHTALELFFWQKVKEEYPLDWEERASNVIRQKRDGHIRLALSKPLPNAQTHLAPTNHQTEDGLSHNADVTSTGSSRQRSSRGGQRPKHPSRPRQRTSRRGQPKSEEDLSSGSSDTTSGAISQVAVPTSFDTADVSGVGSSKAIAISSVYHSQFTEELSATTLTRVFGELSTTTLSQLSAEELSATTLSRASADLSAQPTTPIRSFMPPFKPYDTPRSARKDSAETSQHVKEHLDQAVLTPKEFRVQAVSPDASCRRRSSADPGWFGGTPSPRAENVVWGPACRSLSQTTANGYFNDVPTMLPESVPSASSQSGISPRLNLASFSHQSLSAMVKARAPAQISTVPRPKTVFTDTSPPFNLGDFDFNAAEFPETQRSAESGALETKNQRAVGFDLPMSSDERISSDEIAAVNQPGRSLTLNAQHPSDGELERVLKAAKAPARRADTLNGPDNGVMRQRMMTHVDNSDEVMRVRGWKEFAKVREFRLRSLDSLRAMSALLRLTRGVHIDAIVKGPNGIKSMRGFTLAVNHDANVSNIALTKSSKRKVYQYSDLISVDYSSICLQFLVDSLNSVEFSQINFDGETRFLCGRRYCPEKIHVCLPVQRAHDAGNHLLSERRRQVRLHRANSGHNKVKAEG